MIHRRYSLEKVFKKVTPKQSSATFRETIISFMRYLHDDLITVQRLYIIKPSIGGLRLKNITLREVKSRQWPLWSWAKNYRKIRYMRSCTRR